MRTDVKVGLVCVLILVIAVVAYFAMQAKPKTQTLAQNSTQNTHGAAPATPPTVTPPPADAPPAAAASPANDAPALGFHQPTSLGQTPTPYSPPGAGPATTAPSNTLYPPGSPRSLLPPAGEPTTTGSSIPPLRGGEVTPPGSPSVPGAPSIPGGTPSLRNEPDPLLETIPGARTTRGGLSNPGSSSLAPGSSSGNTYTVQSGDNLTNIARKNGTTVSALKAANPSIDPNHLKVKQVINLPAPGASTPSSSSPSLTPARSANRPAPSTPRSTTAARHSASNTTIAPGTSYKVKKGDTLRKISKAAYGDEKLWARIFRVNRGELASPNDLEPGMVLKIPAR
jgi:nucleoid-associated protein YgaU